MANNSKNRNPFVFAPIVLDQEKHEKRRVIRQLPGVNQTETLQKFFGASMDHLFDPGKGKSINGYVGQKPLWYDPDQDYYIEENSSNRAFYQLESHMVSKSKEGDVTNLLPYTDLVNQLRFQGALTNNHNRLFSQDYYTWCPPIDLDKIINFRQYIWVAPLSNLPAIEITGPTRKIIASGADNRFDLPGYDSAADTEIQALYDLDSLKVSLIKLQVDGVNKSFVYTPGQSFITLSFVPPVESEVVISVYSDVESNALGLINADPRAFGGVALSSTMRVKFVLEKNPDYKSSDVYVVYNVGRKLALIAETNNGVNQTPDYIVMARGAVNGNEWSINNYWTHIDTLSSSVDNDFISANRAIRPIIEYNCNLELYNYGLSRRLDVDFVVEGINDINTLLIQNPSSVVLDGVTIATATGGKINLNGAGGLSSIRLLVRNTVNALINNRIFVLVNQNNTLTLLLESDGSNPSGEPVYGEVIKTKRGSYLGKNLFWNGMAWQISQLKSTKNQAPLFELYDLNGVNLGDNNVYPSSTFQGSRLFNYQQDNTGTRVADPVLGFALVHDNKGQILFENYLSTQKFNYLEVGKVLPINGFYFHKTIVEDHETQGNDWFKATQPTKQSMVDQFVATGRSRTLTISQTPDTTQDITVVLGRTSDTNSFAKTILVEDRDYIRLGRQILIPSLLEGDNVEVRTYNPNSPPSDANGFYSIPQNLQANPDNDVVTVISKGDFYDHFSDIIRKQTGFKGAEYASNNWRDTPRMGNIGSYIIQHSAGMLKTMLLASEKQLDLTAAIRYCESEYSKFKEKFHQKILDYTLRNAISGSASYDVWINNALDDINKGKTKSFPFYLSGMGINDQNKIPTFIPATPSFLGVYPLYQPELLSQGTGGSTLFFVKGHDGSLIQGQNEICARVIYALEQRIFLSVPSSIRDRERPIWDWQTMYSDEFRTNEYSYDEYLYVLRPSFERWSVNLRQDYKTNDTFDPADPWSWNWSQTITIRGDTPPGHWRGIYEKFFGTSRPDLTPWEGLGFSIKPIWWDSRYGVAPYTSDNLVLWTDLEQGYIFQGSRKGINPKWARPGLLSCIPVDTQGRLLHPGPVTLLDADALPGCGICTGIPLPHDKAADWNWGDMGPVEQLWRRSSAFGFAVSTASYLMKPVSFVELGWNTQDLVLLYVGEEGEQWLNQDTMGRPRHADLQIHGDVLEDLSLVSKIGIQQWISDTLISKNSSVKTTFSDKVRGLGAQLAYKVAGFTDASTLVAVSDAFGRIPSEDVSISLYRSPSIKEEVYSGVAIKWTGRGYEVYGYDVLNPSFSTIAGDPNGNKIGIGESSRAGTVINWHAKTYYAVNFTVKYGDRFYRCDNTHTSSSIFEFDFWTEVARPQYADGARLVWFLDSSVDQAVQNISYGSVLKTPQDVANFLNGYDRYLKSRGWSFESMDDTLDVRDWQGAVRSFIIWSSSDQRFEGDFITLSPSSSLVKFTTDFGTIQPVEQIVNGIYAIVDQNGQPISNQDTRVVRNDGSITVSVDSNLTGIFGLRVYISEIEHVMIFNNTTIFGDTIYSPLFNIHQPRLRLQGYKTIGWEGRIDAPGFIVTGNSLVPNFEKAADDFRHFFDVESIENKKLQDRARANFGYEEKDYLDNLLLTPTNQFEFYQGMIQQKGSPTSMTRLLRSNFIRHNKGLKLFEEWAFRVGDYGGQEIQPSLDIQIRQSEFNHNPQLITFEQADYDTFTASTAAQQESARNPYGVIRVLDLVKDNKLAQLDDRWTWRPDMLTPQWPQRDYNEGDLPLPTPGFVKLDEIRFPLATNNDFLDFYATSVANGTTINDNDRVWVYGIGEKNQEGKADLTKWSTYKFNDTGFNIIDTLVPNHIGQGTIVVLDNPLNGMGSINCQTNPNTFYINDIQNSTALDSNGYVISGESLILKDVDLTDVNSRGTFIPRFQSKVIINFDANTDTSQELLTMLPSAGMYIKGIKISVLEKFDNGSTFIVGHENQDDYFVGLKNETPRDISVGYNDPAAVRVQTPDTHYVPSGSTTADIQLVRVGIVDDYCSPTTVTWSWVPANGSTQTGTLAFSRPSDLDANQDYTSTYTKTATLSFPTTLPSVAGTFTVVTNGVQSDQVTLNIIRSNVAGMNFVDLTTVGVYDFSCAGGLTTFYPHNTANSLIKGGQYMTGLLDRVGINGKMTVEVDYFYTKGFELTQYVEGTLYAVESNIKGEQGDLYTWVKTKFATKPLASNSLLWKSGDIIEVAQGEAAGLWSVYKHNGTSWVEIRRQARKINSDLLTSGAIYNDVENELKLVLQLYDPYKGYIPGVADRELYYKTVEDPAVYQNGRQAWGKEQVGRLWWDQSTVRYLDYEIYDSWTGQTHQGTTYRWKNWGRVAPNSSVDIYEWVRSTVMPSNWNDLVASKLSLKIDDKPTGMVSNDQQSYIIVNEWNDDIQSEELIYYFWVKNTTKVPNTGGRKLTAQQVSNVISNITSNDIPYFAVIDRNKIIVGGIKQFLNETDTVLKIRWTQASDVVNNHHKQWSILREEDERNTIHDSLWTKMRDSLVGWDAFTNPDTGLLEPKYVPDANLPKAQQIGSLVRPRQSWFPADQSGTGGQRPNRSAREAFIDCLNDIFSEAPFMDQWFDWANVFDKGEDLPDESRYVTTALDLEDLENLLPETSNAIQPDQCVLIKNTTQASGFWTLWKLVLINNTRTFILEDFQKWRMQEGELWNSATWYADGWSAKNFPNYRFKTYADRDAAGTLDVTLLKGTLIQIDQQSPGDLRWSWDVFTQTTRNQVAKQNSTIKLSDAFWDNSRVDFGPREVKEILSKPSSQRITPTRIQELTNLINYRDGSSEMEFVINSLKEQLLTTLQKNRIFFTMVKSAFKQTPIIDWAFKTSFLYLGGYSEILRQSPVAFKDQIDNVISYLEEVKPYHVKIREYVRRLSYGPDVAFLSIKDFDKPIYSDGTTTRVLSTSTPADQVLLDTVPWSDWYRNYQKINYDLTKWDSSWNPIRRSRIRVLFDRVACSAMSGWDVTPWDPPQLVSRPDGDSSASLSSLVSLYRSTVSTPGSNFYRDAAVDTYNDRNLLVRNGIVTPNRPGTIITVLLDMTHWLWNGGDWIRFESVGWDQGPNMGTASRIEKFYNPELGMERKNASDLIAGCGFDGTIISDVFQNGGWDIFEWDSTGFSSENATRQGQDLDYIDGTTSPADEADPAYIATSGNQFVQPVVDGERPHEMVALKPSDSLIMNVSHSDGLIRKRFINHRNQWEEFHPVANSITFISWDQVGHKITLDIPNMLEDSNGFTPIHDPQNPSTAWVTKVAISKAYRSNSSVNISTPGIKSFKLRDVNTVKGLPSGLLGNGVKVAIFTPGNIAQRVIATTFSTKGVEKNWNGTLLVNVPANSSGIGSAKSWNIIPLNDFHQPGVIWIGNVRFTYTNLTNTTGTTYVLDGVKASNATLSGFDISANMDSVSLAHTSPIFDGSIHRLNP